MKVDAGEKFLIIDGHLDLGLDGVQLKRDLTQPALTVRAHDPIPLMHSLGSCTVTLPELRKGRIGIVFGTVMSRINPNDRWTLTGMYSQEQCYAVGRGHAAYYEALEQRGELRIIRTPADLDDAAALWNHPLEDDQTCSMPIGLVLTMESADPILDPENVPEWHDRGLRMVGIAHYGTSSYSHGTGTTGGLLPRAKPLLKAFEEFGIIPDMTHLTDQAFWELLDVYNGPVGASHHNCRALTPGQRQLDDAMIRAIAERNGVIGAACDVWMLDRGWNREIPAYRQQTSATLKTVADHIDYVAQLTGSVRHCAVGSDLDGGFGTEQAPRDLNTIADLQKLTGILKSRGYAGADIRAVFSENWIRLLKSTWKP